MIQKSLVIGREQNDFLDTNEIKIKLLKENSNMSKGDGDINMRVVIILFTAIFVVFYSTPPSICMSGTNAVYV